MADPFAGVAGAFLARSNFDASRARLNCHSSSKIIPRLERTEPGTLINSMNSEQEKSYRRVAIITEVPPGSGIQVTIDHEDIALFNQAGEFFAVNDLCPHRGAPLNEGFLDQGKVFCPLHCFDFDLKTGACGMAPHLSVATYPTKTENGDVFILY
ncbi:MAG: Rieske 2Fe-2S domain-containing protein [Acidobacteria bacterium]|nr:Rieske 2Fe-2S domain-containing protein [Acidobacteriota bacterium]